MTLYEKIKAIYPQLEMKDFLDSHIMLEDKSDGNGAYIAKWEHPTLPRPTDEQLQGVQA